MNVLLIAAIGLEMNAAEKRWQIFVRKYVLKGGDDKASSTLENLLIAPWRIGLFHAIRQLVMPAEEENSEGEKGWILIRPRVTENCEEIVR